MDLTQWLDLIARIPRIGRLAVRRLVIVCLAASWVAGRRRCSSGDEQFLVPTRRQHSRPMPTLEAPVSAGGFVTTLLPAPEPFDYCSVRYRTRAEFNPFAWLTQLIAPAPEHLVLRAMLPCAARLRACLDSRTDAVHSARSAPRAVSFGPVIALIIVDAEYATRGDTTNGVQHAFGELQNRFGPFLSTSWSVPMCLWRSHMLSRKGVAEPHITVTLSTARFDPAQTPVLIALIRSLGRAATID